MRRIPVLRERPDWEKIIAEENLVYDLYDEDDTEHYWNENFVYCFSQLEHSDIVQQVEELHRLCIDAIDDIAAGTYGHLGLPAPMFRLARDSWSAHRENPEAEMDLYGRFDVIRDAENGAVKLLEYNADTPTSLVESAVCQDTHFLFHFGDDPRFIQPTRLGDALIDRWEEIRLARTGRFGYVDNTLYCACVRDDEYGEDEVSTKLIQHTAQMAGWRTHFIRMEDIVFDTELRRFEDQEGYPIQSIFKLYPWEDIGLDEFADYTIETYPSTAWFEPAWKMFLSTKHLLAILWHRNPGHPNLVPAYVGSPQDLRHYVRKPIFGREGTGIEIVDDGHRVAGDPEDWDASECVFQEYIDTKDVFGGTANFHPVIGAWIVGGKFAGYSIRESDGLITDDSARFTPAIVEQF